MADDETKAVQLDPTAHPGAMVCLCLSSEQQQALRDAAGIPEAECDHLTLCYLGPDAAALAERKNAIVAGLTALAQAWAPLDGTIGGVARFAASESSDEQDVCVALYDCAALPDLRQAAVACCGGSPSDHGFIPHITLAYVEPGAALPVAQLDRTPLGFAALSLIWGGERIDLPLMGAVADTDPDTDDPNEATEGEPVMAYGGAVKSLADYRVRTRGIVWGGHDLEGDGFVKGVTDLGASRSFVGMPVYWDHSALTPQNAIKSQIGVVVDVDEDDRGINFDIELDRSKAYVDDIRALAREGALGSSTSAIPHLVRRRRGVLKRWIAGEISLTPTPMEPRTHPALAAKALQEASHMGDETKPTPETQPAGVDVAQLAANVEMLKAAHAAEVKGLKTALELAETRAATLATEVKSVRTDLDQIKSMPAVKQAKSRDPHEAAQELGGAYGGGLNARADEVPGGYHYFKALQMHSYAGQPTKPTEYPEGIFGGFVKAVFMAMKPSPAIQRDAIKALDEMYGASSESEAAKALGTQAGVSGAFLIPEQFIPTLMMIARQNDVLYGRTMVIPSDGGEMVIPALDPSAVFVEGQSAYYGGVSISWGNDDDAAISAEPKFKQVRLKTNAMKAFTRLKNSLMMRSAIAIDAVVSNLLGSAIGRARDYAILRGTGVGMPLGVMNSPATIDVGGSAIDFATLTGMEDNVIPERDDNYVWIIHSKKRSAIWALQQTNNTLVTILPNLRDRPSTVLLGRPIAWTDKTPFASGDVSNTVNLIDPSMIVVSEFQGLALAVSDQARFEQDETVIRAIMSLDAQPWLTNKIAVTSTPDYVSGFITI